MRLYPSDDLPELHTYGSGPEQDEIKAEAEGLPGVQVNGGIDHAHPSLHGSKLKVPPLAAPQLGSCASSGRAWRLWAARQLPGRGRPTARPATASAARASHLQSRPFHRR